MTETVFLVDVFVGDVHTPGYAHVAVDNQYLTVVTVVLHRGDKGAEGVKHQSLYALFLHFFLVSERQCEL